MVSSTRRNALWVTNKTLTIGYSLEFERATSDDSKLKSFLHIGFPLWIDATGQMQSYLSFSPLLMASEQLYGLQIAPIAGIEQGKGVQCALIGGAKSFDGLVLSPISLVNIGNCIQVGLLSMSGIGRGKGGISGQISVINLVSGRCPSFQLGLINGGDIYFRLDKRNTFCQVGIWNDSRVFDDDESMNGGGSNRLLSTMIQCGLVNVRDDYFSSAVKGNQLGIINLAYRPKSNLPEYQWGLINYSSDNENIKQIGLINFKGKKFMFFYNK